MGRNLYENGSKGSIFDHCNPEYLSQQIEPSSNVTVLSLVVLGMSILLLTIVFFLVIKCRGRRLDKKKGKKANGELTSLGYSKMPSASPFAIGGDDDDEQEEL